MDTYAANLLGALEALDSGITTLLDWSHNLNTPEHSDAALDALAVARVLAALVAFSPSFSFILLGGGRFERLRGNANARAFLDGAGPAAIGAILGAAITLALALAHAWQFGLLAAAAVALLLLRRGVVETLLGAAAIGVIAALAGAPI